MKASGSQLSSESECYPGNKRRARVWSAELDAVMTFCPQLVGQHHLSVPSGHQQISPGIVAKLIRTLDRLPEGWLK